ncbi:GGDEF domain-containing protein [Dyella sp. OK004]|uniref:tetratricopeptide repeat-containing diguanylate cyclase n=1 Tax=Dyella sp. OK004 TaxID=1855292 RepID=UPI0015A522CF|nr:GGDEF domain-containing protein [Dyella sp. OK004]
MPGRGGFIVVVWLLAALAHADGVQERYAQRYRAVSDPHGLIEDVRKQLDTHSETPPPAQERELLWLMGNAAINGNDDAALAEATLRLDSLAAARDDTVASAAAGFLRSRHDIENGDGDGLSEALRAAAKMQDLHDPVVAAWAKFALCDSYTLVEDARNGLPLCQQVQANYRELGDTWGLAEAENDEGANLATLNRAAEAAKAYERSRAHFRSVGADQLVVMVGDNLARMYLDLGRAHEALALSQASLAQEQAAGRVSDALLSRANIARAYEAMGRRGDALEQMKTTIADAQAAGKDGLLPDLLQTRSGMAEKAGNSALALADAREVIRLLADRRSPALRSTESALEARYVTREKELRIRDLEHQNRLKDLALKAAQAEAERQDEARRRQALSGLIAKLIAGGVILIAVLLYLLLRAQRRHAVELRDQALRDPLTGIGNRRAFLQRASALVQDRGDPRQASHVLMLIDFDHFKRINDSAGHPQGDRVLAVVVDYMRETVGKFGHLARIGGEEFAVLCPRFGAEAGLRLAEVLRAGVAALPLPPDVPVEHVTVSIGLALLDGVRCGDLDGWMRAADAALYAAKSYGRDRVVASALVS